MMLQFIPLASSYVHRLTHHSPRPDPKYLSYLPRLWTNIKFHAHQNKTHNITFIVTCNYRAVYPALTLS
jgi:hypothetical protein